MLSFCVGKLLPKQLLNDYLIGNAQRDTVHAAVDVASGYESYSAGQRIQYIERGVDLDRPTWQNSSEFSTR